MYLERAHPAFLTTIVVLVKSLQEIRNLYFINSAIKAHFQQPLFYCFSQNLFRCGNGSIGWPTQRLKVPNNFVASVVSRKSILWETCPENCRRKGHENWKHC